MLVLVCLLLLLGAVSPFTPAPFLLSYNALSTRLHAVRFSVPDNLPVSTTVREGVTSLYDDNGESLASSDLSQTVPETEADGGALYDQSSQSPPDPRAFVLKTVAPAVVSVGGVATAAYLGLTSFNRKQASLVATFANEMVYHSNNHDELRLCYMETKKKLWGKKETLISDYLTVFMKKKTVSISAISSLSYVFSLFKLSESAAAAVLVSSAKNLRKQPATRGKLLFFGERILKSPEGHKKLQPIRDMLASNYRSGGQDIVKLAQKTMAQSAYRAMVVSAGESGGVVAGYDILGLSVEEAKEVFEDAAEQSFKTDAENYYKSEPDAEYDEKGNKILDPSKKIDLDPYGDLTESQRAARGLPQKSTDEDEKIPEPVEGAEGTHAFECEDCGYTLFPAAGREEKFFGDDFVCPDCGAAKDKFKERGTAS